MNIRGIHYALMHPRVLRQRNDRYESMWATAGDLACAVSHAEYGEGAPRSFSRQLLSSIIGGLFVRNMRIIAHNVGIRIYQQNPMAIVCDFLAGNADGTSVVAVIACGSVQKYRQCRRHARGVKASLQAILHRRCRVGLFLALFDETDPDARGRLVAT